MKINLNIETNDPNDLTRIAAALAGQDVAVTTTTSPKARKTETPPTAPSAPASSSTAQTAAASTPAATTATASVPAEADIVAAANAAVAKIGPSGASKVKEYIAKNFQCADGSPGKLKQVAEGQRANLLAALQGIAQGTVAV